MFRMIWHEIRRHKTWVGMWYQGCDTCDQTWSR